MLALDTGWTPDTLAELPHDFRRAAHWALYARTLAGAEGLPSTDVPPGTRRTPADMQRAVAVKELRGLLYPEDVTDG